MKKIVLFGFMAVCILLAECFKESRCLLPITEIQTEESHDIVYLHHPQSSLQIWRTDERVKIPLLSQNPVLPNGCEVTSLAMVLSSAGYPVEPVELYEQYLPVRGFTYVSSQRDGPSPEEFYVGDATSRNGGWYCFEKPVITAGNVFLHEHGDKRSMQRVSGVSDESLDWYAGQGIPVIIWVTIDYEAPEFAQHFSWILPDGDLYVPYSNLHCVVLAGEEDGKYRIANPLEGWETVDKNVVWQSFRAMGRRAVILSSSL